MDPVQLKIWANLSQVLRSKLKFNGQGQIKNFVGKICSQS